MTPESMPAGGLMAVTEDPGEAANSSKPRLTEAARVAWASNWALATMFAMPVFLMKRRLSAIARIRAVEGVQLDSPPSALFFSFLRLK